MQGSSATTTVNILADGTTAFTRDIANGGNPPFATDLTLSDDGLPLSLGAFSYQWLRNGVDIGGATGATYTLGDDDVGRKVGGGGQQPSVR